MSVVIDPSHDKRAQAARRIHIAKRLHAGHAYQSADLTWRVSAYPARTQRWAITEDGTVRALCVSVDHVEITLANLGGPKLAELEEVAGQ